MSLFMAVVTATVFAIFGPPYVRLQCWFSWSRAGTIIVVVLYLILAGGGGGFLGWLAAQYLKAAPTESPIVNGVLYGVGGALVLRADFASSRPTTVSAIDANRHVADVSSLLGASLQWVTGMLDTNTKRCVAKWLAGLSNKELLAQALRINAAIVQSDVGDDAKKTLQAQFVPAMEQVNSSDETIRAEGRALLEHFCMTYTAKEHLAKVATPGSRRM